MSRALSTFIGTTDLVIPATHPAMSGHFPGLPIVPGALLLTETLSRVEHASGTELYLQKILSAKFLKPVIPEDHITVRYEGGQSQAERGTLSITLYSASTVVAKFILELSMAVGPGAQ